MHRLLIGVVGLLFAGASANCAHPGTQNAGNRVASNAKPISRSEAVANTSIPAGEARGVAVDALSGATLQYVSIGVLRNDSLWRHRTVQTDASGSFKVVNIPPGPLKLRATLIGYKQEDIAISGDSGVVVRFTMRGQPMIACGMQVGVPAVAVIVRDAVTGVGPSTPVLLRVKDHSYVDSASTGPATYRDSVELGAAPYRKGVYEVNVTAPNYQPFHLSGVRAKVENYCHYFLGQRLSIWLLPKS